jgi:hypothetical protein
MCCDVRKHGCGVAWLLLLGYLAFAVVVGSWQLRSGVGLRGLYCVCLSLVFSNVCTWLA